MIKIKKLTVLASMSGGGKTTYANKNYSPQCILPDTNNHVYEIYQKLFKDPAEKQNLSVEPMTGFAMWSTKFMSDMTFLNSMKIGAFYDDLPDELVNMRSGWDFLIYDEIWQGRKIISEDEMFKFINKIESQFREVKYLIWDMQDEKIIQELMDRKDGRSALFNHDPKVYQEWQKHYISRYKEIMEKFGYDYELKEVRYT